MAEASGSRPRQPAPDSDIDMSGDEYISPSNEDYPDGKCFL